jgi:hypothetical protein
MKYSVDSSVFAFTMVVAFLLTSSNQAIPDTTDAIRP